MWSLCPKRQASDMMSRCRARLDDDPLVGGRHSRSVGTGGRRGRRLPRLRATPGSRVVTMSSMGARLGHVDLADLQWERRPYDRWQAYFQSKLANLLFTAELDRRLRAAESTTSALAAHPGGSRTG